MSDFYTSVVRFSNKLLVRRVSGGQPERIKVNYKPTLYLPTKKDTSEIKNLAGEPLVPYQLGSMSEASQFIKQYENNLNLIYGLTQYPYTWIADEYPNRIEYNFSDISISTIDIEVACENGFPDPNKAEEEMLSITVKNQKTRQIIVFGLYKYTNPREDVLYVECEDEKDLLTQFLNYWVQFYPDIITGWNTVFFDIPYLCNRITKVLSDKHMKKLSPWGLIEEKKINKMGKDYKTFTLVGISNLDYYELYRKFTYTNQESYKLDHIAHVELGERKDENPYETFREWYTNDYQSFIDYNIQDVEIVDKLEDKMRLIELVITMAYEAKVNYEDALTSVKYWDVLIYNYLRNKNIALPQKVKNKTEEGDEEGSESFTGAYVKEPQVGQHKWVMSFDLNSLYPHLIMQYNISPETMYEMTESEIQPRLPHLPPIYWEVNVQGLLDKENPNKDFLQENNLTQAGNGMLYRKDVQGFLPKIMEEMYEDRSKYKKLMIKASQDYEETKDPKLKNDISKYNNIQMAKKISLNSAYGAVGNKWFRFFDLRNAEAITLSGQLSIRWIENKLNIYLNSLLKTNDVDYVIASDTDSVYIRFDELVSTVFKNQDNTLKIVEFLDTIANEKIEPFIDKSYQELADNMNAYSQKMQMKREVIADKGIWTAKKRYILNAWDIEGVRYKEPKLKIMGIEAVKSSTPAPCREKIKEALKIIMTSTEDNLKSFIDDFKTEFKSMPIETISFPRSVNNIEKWRCKDKVCKKGTPIHVKGAIWYNELAKRHKLTHKYPYIQNGDKIKYAYMKTNKYTTNSMSFITKFPKELNMNNMVDYDLQFEKSFIEPLKLITNSINWNIIKVNTLESFFE